MNNKNKNPLRNILPLKNMTIGKFENVVIGNLKI